jgi:hypothetical protein
MTNADETNDITATRGTRVASAATMAMAAFAGECCLVVQATQIN